MVKIVVCKECGEKKMHKAHGLCQRCYDKMQHAKYYKANKDDILTRNQLYYDATRTTRLSQMGEYRETNAEAIRNYKKRYYESRIFIHFLGKIIPAPNLPKQPDGYVYHHICYDHSDPEANVVLLSRYTHWMGHRLLKELGIEIPHINMGVDYEIIAPPELAVATDAEYEDVNE